VGPALLARLAAALADAQAAPEGALCPAVDLLGALGDAPAVPILLRCLAHDDRGAGLAPPAAAALRTLGPAARKGGLAASAMTPHAAFRDRLAGGLSRCGVHDERGDACRVETRQRTPELGATDLAAYGEARALDVLAHAVDTLPLRDEASPLAHHVFIELRAALEDLGGQLTVAQHRKFEAADTARRRWVAQMPWATDPSAAPPGRTPLRAPSVTGTPPPLPVGTRNLGRNAPCWCGSGQKSKQCHLPLERREGDQRAGVYPSDRDQTAMAAPQQGQRRGGSAHPLGITGVEVVQSHGTGVEKYGGVWALRRRITRDAARETVVVTKTDADPENYDESAIPLRGMPVGRNRAVVGYIAGEHADKRRPCNHWCGKQPVDETGSGQA
jgi:hypothetical protein